MLVVLSHYRRKVVHFNVGKDTPVERPIQPRPAEGGNLIEIPRVGGLHHRYKWRKAAEETRNSIFALDPNSST